MNISEEELSEIVGAEEMSRIAKEIQHKREERKINDEEHGEIGNN